MSDTPRTDEFCDHMARLGWKPGDPSWPSFASQLERELIELQEKLSKIYRMVDIADLANDAASEQEVARSATFHEAIAYETLSLTEAERDALRSEVAELKALKIEEYRGKGFDHELQRKVDALLVNNLKLREALKYVKEMHHEGEGEFNDRVIEALSGL